MKAASVKQIKDQLENLTEKELQEICLRFTKYRVENKELVTYLLFEADDESGYIEHIKDSLLEIFEDINCSNLYYAKKTIRKIIRHANKYIKYSGISTTEAEILIFLIQELQQTGIDFSKSTVLMNILKNLYKKIEKCIASMHEDLQYDYQRKLDQLKH